MGNRDVSLFPTGPRGRPPLISLVMGDGRSGKRGGRDTQRGFGTSHVLERGHPAESGSSQVEHPSRPPGDIEIEYLREEGPAHLLEGRWRAYEVWTAEHIYVLGDDLECIEVIGRSSGRAEPEHPVEGARLVGGELRDSAGLIREVSHPLPQIGARAVFTKSVGERQRMSETTPVTRVVLRQRVVSIRRPGSKRPSWRDITGRHELP